MPRKPPSLSLGEKAKETRPQRAELGSPKSAAPTMAQSGSASTSQTSSLSAQPLPRNHPRSGRHVPSALSGGNLETPQRGTIYRNSPASSVASMSHGNLLETASIASSSAAGDDDQSETGTGHSLPRGPGEVPRERRPSRHAYLQNMLSRTRSTKMDQPPAARNPPKIKTTSNRIINSRSRERREPPTPSQDVPHTAPLSPDRGFRDAMESSTRNRSADRNINQITEEESKPQAQQGPGRFQNFMNTSTQAAGQIGRAGKGFMSKFTRSGSSNEREEPQGEYVLQLIRQPLIVQVRATRLRTRMAEARDKTEYWLPALPYRCIDFLNHKGVEQEGLYRVPGSVKDIKAWEARFDQERDINLLDVPDFDDIYTIGSMLKAWLRELPEDIFPKETQSRIARECASFSGGPTTPDMLKNELSKLPPFNYYLLFAITAHITLLSKFAEVNKMSYQNLCICFQPCINIDAFTFHFLVNDWRSCWQGCYTEREWLDREAGVGSGQGSSTSSLPIQQESQPSTSSQTQLPQSAASSSSTIQNTQMLPSRPKTSGATGSPGTTSSSSKPPSRSPERKPIPSRSTEAETSKTNGNTLSIQPPIRPARGDADLFAPESLERPDRLEVREGPYSPESAVQSPESAQTSSPPELEPLHEMSPLKM